MYRQLEKNLLNSNISSTCSHNMVNFSPLAAEIGLPCSLGHPSKFQLVSRLGFVMAATSLNGDQPNFAQCLAISWAGTLYINFGGSCRLMEFCQVQIHFACKSCVLLYCQHYCMALKQWESAPNFAAWYKEWNYGIFAACHFQQRVPPIFRGQSSRWATVHALVKYVKLEDFCITYIMSTLNHSFQYHSGTQIT